MILTAVVVAATQAAEAQGLADALVAKALQRLKETSKPGTAAADRVAALEEAMHQLVSIGREKEIEPLLDEELSLVKRRSALPDMSKLALGLDVTQGWPLPDATPGLREWLGKYLQLDHFKAVAKGPSPTVAF